MSRTVADILFRARFDAGNSQQSAANLSNSLNGVGNAANNASNGIQGMGNQLQSIIGGNLIAGAIQKIGSAVIDLGKATIDASRETQKLKSDLNFFITAKTGNTNLGNIIYGDLKKFAEQNPVANLKTSIEQTRDLIAKGFGTREAFELVRSFTDITAGNVDQLNSLSYVLGEIRLKGRVTGQEIAQFASGGVNIVELASKLPEFQGKSLAQTKKLLTETSDAYGIVTDAILKSTQEGGAFFQRSENAAKTLEGSIAALEDAFFNLQSEIGDGANPVVQEFVKGLTSIINAARTFVASDEFIEYFNEIGAALSDVISPLYSFYDLLTSDSAKSGFKLLATAIKDELKELGAAFKEVAKIIDNINNTALVNSNSGEGFLSRAGTTLKALSGTLRESVGLESKTLAEIRSKAADIKNSQDKKTAAEEEAFRQFQIRELKRVAEENDKIETQRLIARGNLQQLTILGLEKFRKDLTEEEYKRLEILGGFAMEERKVNNELSDKQKKEAEKKQKEREAQAKKIKEYKEKELQNEIDYNERLQEVIRRNNQTISTLREGADTPLEKQLVSNKNAYDNAIAAADKFAAEIVDKEKAIQKELGTIPSNIAAEIAKSNERVATIRAQASTILSLENTKAYKEQQEKIQAIFEEGENQLTQLRIENDSKRLALIEQSTQQQLDVVLKSSKAEQAQVNENYNKILRTERKKYDDLGALGVEFTTFSEKLEEERAQSILIIQSNLAQKQFEIIQNGYKEQISELERQNKLQVTETDTQNAYLLQATEKGSIERANLELKIRKETIEKQIEFEAELQERLSEQRIGASKKDATDIDQQIADSRNRVAQLGQEQVDIEQEQSDKRKQNVLDYIDLLSQASETIFSVFNTINDAQIAAIDKQIDAQSKRIDKAKDLAEKGNADLLQIEQNRLDQLEAKKRKAAERQILINRAQQISAQLLAVAQIAASEAGTGPAAPFLIPLAIASVIASMAAGFVEAQALEKGTQFVDKEAHFGYGVDKVPAMSSSGKMYKLNRGEAVITKGRNAEYRDVINGVHNGLVPANEANAFFRDWKNYKSSDFSIPSIQNITVLDNSGVVSELKENNKLMRKMLDRREQINIVLPNGKRESLSSRIDWLRNNR